MSTQTPVHHEPGEEYAGPATLRAATTGGSAGDADPTDTAQDIAVRVDLRGVFQPIDGRFHWYGRIATDEAVSALGSGTEVELDTGLGTATGRLSDVDPWGRLRVAGTGTPPF